MRKIRRNKQKGVFAIEFALGFIVLFMFTMLIFETCRLTYICSVLDYATAEAARDSRVQLEANNDFSDYKNVDCKEAFKDDLNKQDECEQIQNFNGDEYQVWFYSFVKKNGGSLWHVLSAADSYTIAAKHYKNLEALIKDTEKNALEGDGNKYWQGNAFTLYEINYSYHPLFFKGSFLSMNIKRRALVIEEFERHNNDQ